MKKLFIFITALLAVLALAACGSNKTQSATPTAATTPKRSVTCPAA